MEKERKQVKLLTTGGVRGTGNILRDLLSSTVSLPRVQVTGGQSGLEIEESSVSMRNESCSICGDMSEGCQPLTQDEINTVEELVLPSFATSWPNWLCPNCYTTLKKLSKLRKEIQDIIQCLRAVVKIQRKDDEGEKRRLRLEKEDFLVLEYKSQPESKLGRDEGVDLDNSSNVDIKIEPIAQEDYDLDLGMNYLDESEIDVKLLVPELNDPLALPEEDDVHNIPQVKRKRMSRVRAEEFLHSVTKMDNDERGLDKNGETSSNFDTQDNQYIKTDDVGHSKKNRSVPPSKEKRFPCSECSFSFADSKGLSSHKKRVHEGFRFKCDLCSKDFGNKSSLRYHKGKVHQDEACLKVVASQARRGMIARSKKLVCGICRKTCNGSVTLGRHIELNHFSDKTSCPFGCPDKIDNDQEWLQHVEYCNSAKMTDTSTLQLHCGYCRDIFPNQFLKIVHILRLHSAYSCEQCGQFFSSKEILSRHKTRHEMSERDLCQTLE